MEQTLKQVWYELFLKTRFCKNLKKGRNMLITFATILLHKIFICQSNSPHFNGGIT